MTKAELVSTAAGMPDDVVGAESLLISKGASLMINRRLALGLIATATTIDASRIAFAKEKHHLNGKDLLGEKIKKNGKHKIHTTGKKADGAVRLGTVIRHRPQPAIRPLSADIVAKVFLRWRTKIPRAADAFYAQRREGPYRFIQNRSRTSVVALKSDAAAEKSQDRLSRAF